MEPVGWHHGFPPALSSERRVPDPDSRALESAFQMAGPARVMWTFDGLPLLTLLPYSPSFYQGLLFDDAASARLRAMVDRWVESQPAADPPEHVQRLRD